MFVTFITIRLFWHFCLIIDYRDTRAYILDPCIQEFSLEVEYNVNDYIKHSVKKLKSTLQASVEKFEILFFVKSIKLYSIV